MEQKKELSIMIGGAVRRSKINRSPQSKKNYELFLNGDTPKNRRKSSKRSDIRVIKVSKKKEVAKPIAKEVKKEVAKPIAKEVKKEVAKPIEGPVVKEVAKNTMIKEEEAKKYIPKHKKSRKSNKSSRKSRKRNHKRSSKRISSRNKLHSKYVNNRKVSLKCVPHSKKKNIDKILNAINIMSDKEIKEKLSKKGITIKSNKQQLLKDMYIFSELGGIKIHKE